MQTNIHTYIQTYIHTYIPHIHTTHTYHTYMHTYMHTSIHTYIYYAFPSAAAFLNKFGLRWPRCPDWAVDCEGWRIPLSAILDLDLGVCVGGQLPLTRVLWSAGRQKKRPCMLALWFLVALAFWAFISFYFELLNLYFLFFELLGCHFLSRF